MHCGIVIDSASNVISTALAGRPAAEVVASGLSPAVNNQIKKATTDAKGNVNTALNLTAHALWGAVEAYAGNRNVAAGAAGAAGGEAAAHFLASTLYNKSPEKLSEEEKRTVSSLSQVAAGIAGGSLSDSSDGAIIAAKTAKDAVENNFFDQAYKSTDYANGLVANATVQTQLSEATRQAAEEFEKAHPELVKNLRTTGDIGAFLADFTPIIGDIKSFVEAENGIDYALATVGLIPGADVVTKPLKEAKNALNMAKAAEKAGNVAEAIKYQKEAIKQFESVKALDVDSYKVLKARSVVGDNLDLDHIPSFAAQIKSLEKDLGRQLTREEKYKLKNEATAIAIPKEVHKNSRTYGGRNSSSQTLKDSKDLCGAQCLDLEQNKNNLLNYGFDEDDINQAIEKALTSTCFPFFSFATRCLKIISCLFD